MYKYDIHINEESSIAPDTLDMTFRETEIKNKPTIIVYHSGYKEGRIGIFCSDCKDLLVASISL